MDAMGKRKIVRIINAPVRIPVGILSILLGGAIALAVPGIGLFFGLPFLLLGGELLCGC